MSLVKELCNFCVCVNVEMSNHIKILFFFHNWSYLALNIDCVFLCLLPFWELKDLKPEPGQYHPTCAIWDFFFSILYCHYLHCHCLQPVTFTNAGVFFRLHRTTFLKQQLLLAACFKVCLTSIHYNTFLLQVYFSCRLQLEAAILPALQEIKVLCHCISSIQCFICPHLCRWFALGVCFVRISNLSGLILVTDFRT